MFSLMMLLTSCSISLQEIETIGEAKIETSVSAELEKK